MNKLNTILIIVISVLCSYTVSCQLDIAANKDKLQGIWEQVGYGVVVNIKDDEIAIYNTCSYSCVPFFEIDLEDLEEEYELQSVSADRFVLRDGITEYDLQRLDKLPDLCTNLTEEQSQDVMFNFETLWHTFNERYAYFDQRGVDWLALKKKYQSQLNPNSTDVELFRVLSELLEELNDGHVYIAPSDAIEEAMEIAASQGSDGSSAIEENETQEGEPEANDTDQDEDDIDIVDQLRQAVAGRYIDNLQSYNLGKVMWGTINDDMAYVQINSMMNLANYNIDEGADKATAYDQYTTQMQESDDVLADELDGCRYIMNKILTDIGGVNSVVLDVRFNGGGHDAVALELLSSFVSEEIPAFSKKARLGSGYTRDQYINVTPGAKVFSGDVYILTSHNTASASEIFTMASMVLPHAIRIGSNTEGVFSDILNKSLPIGIAYSISNEVYHDARGREYEGVGIPPHFEITYSKDPEQFLNQIMTALPQGDAAIDKAIKLHRMKK